MKNKPIKTNSAFIIDGVPLVFNAVSPIDVEKEKYYDEGESGEVNPSEPTELGETLRELNNDKIDPKSNMSEIDMRSRLHGTEIAGILAIDTLVALKFLPTDALSFTRQKKRLAVSLNGEGRKEVVDIAGGKQDRDMQRSGMGIADRIKSMFKPKGGMPNAQ